MHSRQMGSNEGKVLHWGSTLQNVVLLLKEGLLIPFSGCQTGEPGNGSKNGSYAQLEGNSLSCVMKDGCRLLCNGGEALKF